MKTYIPTNKLLLYGKEQGSKKFSPVDISKGTLVKNLLYASLIPPDKFEQLKAMAETNVKYGVQSYIKETGTNKILFRTNNTNAY